MDVNKIILVTIVVLVFNVLSMSAKIPYGKKGRIIKRLRLNLRKSNGKIFLNEIHRTETVHTVRKFQNNNKLKKRIPEITAAKNTDEIRTNPAIEATRTNAELTSSSSTSTTTKTTPTSTIKPLVPASNNIQSDETINIKIRKMFTIVDNNIEEPNSVFQKALLANRLNEDHVIPPEFQSSITPIDEIILNPSTNGNNNNKNRCTFCDFFHNVKDRLVLTEGDVMMKYDDFVYFYGNGSSNGSTSRTKRALLPSSRNRGWPDNTIPVDADLSFSSGEIDEIIRALREWNTYTCIKFRDVTANDRASNIPRVRFIGTDQGCYSFIGRQGGQQIIQLLPKCRTKRTIVHEVGHAIGFFHEHVRPDRDENVEILFNNIPQDSHFNFRRVDDARSLGVPYDFLSIMHYSEKAFTRNGNGISIRARDSRFQKLMGRATQLSFRDVKQANLFLNCAARCPQRRCPGEGFLDKNCRCRCPSVFEPSGVCGSGSTVLQANDPRISRFPTDQVNFQEEIRTIENFQQLFNRLGTVSNSTSLADLPAF